MIRTFYVQPILNQTSQGGLTVNGISYPSIRHGGGTCLVSFWPDRVQNLRHEYRDEQPPKK
jgi:hypothetical protein